MWVKFLAWLSYLLGSRAGVAQQKQAEVEGFDHAAQDIAKAEDAAPTDRDATVDRLRKSGL